MERYTFLFDLEIQYCENVYDTKSSLQIQSNFFDITNVTFHISLDISF